MRSTSSGTRPHSLAAIVGSTSSMASYVFTSAFLLLLLRRRLLIGRGLPVESRHRLVDPFVHPAADGVARRRHQLLHRRPLLLREPAQHPVRVGLAAAHAEAHPRVGV